MHPGTKGKKSDRDWTQKEGRISEAGRKTRYGKRTNTSKGGRIRMRMPVLPFIKDDRKEETSSWGGGDRQRK